MTVIDYRLATPGLLSGNAGYADYTPLGLTMDNGTDGLHVDAVNGLRNGDNFSSHAATIPGLAAGGYKGFLLNGNPGYYLSDNETTRFYLNQSDGTPAYEMVVRAPAGVFDRVIFQRWDGAAFAAFSSSFGASWTGPLYNTAVGGNENIGFILNGSNELELYIDGVLQFTSIVDTVPLDTTGEPAIRIGANSANTVSVQGVTDELNGSLVASGTIDSVSGDDILGHSEVDAPINVTGIVAADIIEQGYGRITDSEGVSRDQVLEISAGQLQIPWVQIGDLKFGACTLELNDGSNSFTRPITLAVSPGFGNVVIGAGPYDTSGQLGLQISQAGDEVLYSETADLGSRFTNKADGGTVSIGADGKAALSVNTTLPQILKVSRYDSVNNRRVNSELILFDTAGANIPSGSILIGNAAPIMSAYTADESAVDVSVAVSASNGLTINPIVATKADPEETKLKWGYNNQYHGTQLFAWDVANKEIPQSVRDVLAKLEGGKWREPGGLNANRFKWWESIGPDASRDAQQQFRYDLPLPGNPVLYGLDEGNRLAAEMGAKQSYVINIVGEDDQAIPYTNPEDVIDTLQSAQYLAKSVALLALYKLEQGHWGVELEHIFEYGNETTRSFMNFPISWLEERCIAARDAIRAVYTAYNARHGTSFVAKFQGFGQEFDWFMDETSLVKPNAWAGNFGLKLSAPTAAPMVPGRLYRNTVTVPAEHDGYVDGREYTSEASLECRMRWITVPLMNTGASDAFVTVFLYEGDNPDDPAAIYPGSTRVVTVPAGTNVLTDFESSITNLLLTDDKVYSAAIGTNSPDVSFGVSTNAASEVAYQDIGTLDAAPFVADGTVTGQAVGIWMRARAIVRRSELIQALMDPARIDCDYYGQHLYMWNYPSIFTSTEDRHGATWRVANQLLPTIAEVHAIKPGARVTIGESGRANDTTTSEGKNAVNGLAAALAHADMKMVYMQVQDMWAVTEHGFIDGPQQPFDHSLDGGNNTLEATPRVLGPLLMRELLNHTPIPLESAPYATQDLVQSPVDGYLSRGQAYRNANGDKLGVSAVNISNQPMTYEINNPAYAGLTVDLKHNHLSGQAGQEFDPEYLSLTGAARQAALDVYWGFTHEPDAAVVPLTFDGTGLATVTLPPMSVNAMLFTSQEDTDAVDATIEPALPGGTAHWVIVPAGDVAGAGVPDVKAGTSTGTVASGSVPVVNARTLNVLDEFDKSALAPGTYHVLAVQSAGTTDSAAVTDVGQFTVTGTFGVVTQPSDQTGLYNVANTYDVGAGVFAALSYEISPAVAGFSIDDAGIVSYDGTNPDPSVAVINVIAYDAPAQAGNSVALDPYNHYLDLPTAAVIDFGVPLGWATLPSSVLKDAGIDGVEFATWEFVSIPAGTTAAELPGGDANYSALTTGTYTFSWRYWDRTAIQTGDDIRTITVATNAPVVTSPAAISGTPTPAAATVTQTATSPSSPITYHAIVVVDGAPIPTNADIIGGTGLATGPDDVQASGVAGSVVLDVSGLAPGDYDVYMLPVAADGSEGMPEKADLTIPAAATSNIAIGDGAAGGEAVFLDGIEIPNTQVDIKIVDVDNVALLQDWTTMTTDAVSELLTNPVSVAPGTMVVYMGRLTSNILKRDAVITETQ